MIQSKFFGKDWQGMGRMHTWFGRVLHAGPPDTSGPAWCLSPSPSCASRPRSRRCWLRVWFPPVPLACTSAPVACTSAPFAYSSALLAFTSAWLACTSAFLAFTSALQSSACISLFADSVSSTSCASHKGFCGTAAPLLVLHTSRSLVPSLPLIFSAIWGLGLASTTFRPSDLLSACCGTWAGFGSHNTSLPLSCYTSHWLCVAFQFGAVVGFFVNVV